MLNYELSQVVHVLTPILGSALSVIIGIIISNMFWKARIHRYAKTEIVETLEYQKNKIEHLEEELREKKIIISDQAGNLKIAKMTAMKIIGVTK